MNELSHPYLEATNERLASSFYTNRRYLPLLLAVAGAGFLTIHLLARFGALGEPAPQLLYIAVITFLFATAELPILSLAREKKGVAAHLVGAALTGLYAVLLVLFWQGITILSMLIVAAPVLQAFRNGLPRRYVPAFLALASTAMFAIIYLHLNPPLGRLQSGSPAAIASLIFLLASAVLLATIIIISQGRRFRSLQSLLLTAFVLIVTISTVMTAVLSAVGAYTNSQTQIFNSLEAVTTLKVNQIEGLIADSRNDTETLLADPRFISNTLEALLAANSGSTAAESLKRTARSRMVDVLGAEEEAYNEIMVLDPRGNVIISTDPAREGTSFAGKSFFENGLSEFYVEFAEEALFGTENLMIAVPVADPAQGANQGILVLRSNAAHLKEIMETTAGFPEVETYLVDEHFRPITRTRSTAGLINTQAAVESIRDRVSGIRRIYPNYTDQQVLGYYTWFPSMQAAVIAEVPLSFVVTSSLQSLVGSALLAVFVVAVSIAAVVISARAIADPIRHLVETSQNFAAGKFFARATVDRDDEIGALSQAYNRMADQLQEMIGKLEQRVMNRTRELESQTFRLRVAAEIARDAASARDLAELLDRTAELICSRFGFDHTGIFLLDKNREYAVLVASPTDAGRKMIENNHKLRVGEIGIVGRVAATGEPRVTLNTGTDAVYFNNPYLPDTRSEMSLPLKVESQVIGVVDVQSNQLQAFNQDDVAIMQILADQLAIAIERTRLLQEVEINLRELESAYGRFTRDNWSRISTDSPTGNKGYRFDNVRIEPVHELPELAHRAMQTGSIVSSNGSSPEQTKEHKVAVPIKLRGQTIGVINLKLKDGYDPSTISIIEQATERLAAAMESARLYEEARLRADREQSIARVTTAISSATEYEQILQTTVREIGSILGETEVAIQILDEPATGSQSERKEP